MPLVRTSLQTLGAVVLLALALACHGKGGSSVKTSATISGTVTYQRVPLVKDAQGKPTGLADASVTANLVTLPAQGCTIQVYQQVQQTNSDGTIASAWILAAAPTTTSVTTGTYSVTVPTGRPTMVQVASIFNAGGSTIQLIAEPLGINSPTPVPDRLQYALRKAADGSAPANTNVPATVLSADTIVNFSVGLNDPWWICNPALVTSNAANTASSNVAPYLDQAVLETTLSGRTPGLGTGSRVLGIGDTIASFLAVYGSAGPGGTLDLHYWPGLDSGGSYVVYDRSQNPLSLATGTYFGTLRGGPTNDDAWDEGVILPLLARNVLFAANSNRTFSVPLNPLFPPSAALADLSVDVARIEGLAQAMAANILKSPYLADTQGTSLASVLDIRDTSGLTAAQKTPYSAPALRAFGWELILKANGLPSPGSTTDWANINVLAAARFFITTTVNTGVGLNGLAIDLEPLNVYTHITRLKEAKNTAEPVDLAAVFTDPVLTALGSPYGIPWPRPTTGPYASFVANWGTDPTGPFPVAVLSMAKAVQVNAVYPNLSQGEVFYAGFNLSADKQCILTATLTPALGAGAQIELDLPQLQRTFSFTGAGGTTGPIILPVVVTPPAYYPVRLRLKSSATLQPDITVNLTLTPTL